MTGRSTSIYFACFVNTGCVLQDSLSCTEPVGGLAVLEGELFLLHRSGLVLVYDSVNYGEPRDFRMPPTANGSYIDLASCQHRRWLLICRFPVRVYIADPQGQKIGWLETMVNINGISVTPGITLLVRCWFGKLVEFTLDGKMLQEVKLYSDPMQAV